MAIGWSNSGCKSGTRPSGHLHYFVSRKAHQKGARDWGRTDPVSCGSHSHHLWPTKSWKPIGAKTNVPNPYLSSEKTSFHKLNILARQFVDWKKLDRDCKFGYLAELTTTQSQVTFRPPETRRKGPEAVEFPAEISKTKISRTIWSLSESSGGKIMVDQIFIVFVMEGTPLEDDAVAVLLDLRRAKERSTDGLCIGRLHGRLRVSVRFVLGTVSLATWVLGAQYCPQQLVGMMAVLSTVQAAGGPAPAPPLQFARPLTEVSVPVPNRLSVSSCLKCGYGRTIKLETHTAAVCCCRSLHGPKGGRIVVMDNPSSSNGHGGSGQNGAVHDGREVFKVAGNARCGLFPFADGRTMEVIELRKEAPQAPHST
ncbi:hypothetical protein BKA70DRAFT_1232171 [Coprinopsis sp. MPI-PUGE-AT-0042]|nr:hypothetical protein BKA70DRAFT_1232171 [Coprinopsis sp. MPI-PUGE-AT-0042]